MIPILTTALRLEQDLVTVRRRAREISALLGFDDQDQTRIATAVSEIARNAFRYGRGGKAEFLLEGTTAPQVLMIRISDQGPGISELDEVLSGQYQSTTGLGMGIAGARRLMDQFEVSSEPGRGTVVILKKLLPRRARLLTAHEVGDLSERISRTLDISSPYEELRQQNQELIEALDEVRKRQHELQVLNSELEDTNRGVVALYAELDEKADHLSRADDLKSRFLSNMSHEFRTPVNSIIALSGLLLNREDGPLTAEQEKQINYVRKAAENLLELVNDLLDLAKVEAGKVDVRPIEFEVVNLFSALRGMLRPLLVDDQVSLVFEETSGLPALFTDEAKVSQVLRNFISNALKYTERGEVRVRAELSPDGGQVLFSVKDTGIGIALEDQDRIFQEFTQIQNRMQRRVKGTGLGLPLSKRLAELLGGSVRVESEPGQGSTFFLAVPIRYEMAALPLYEPSWQIDPALTPVLLVEDSIETRLVMEKYLRGSRYQPVSARSVREARSAMNAVRPRAIILDIVLQGEDTWQFLTELKDSPATRNIPVIVQTVVEDPGKAMALGADAFHAKPLDRQWLLSKLDTFTNRGGQVLIIDDDEVSRYVLRQALRDSGCPVVEAADGYEGLRQAHSLRPSLVLLDLIMPGIDGFSVLDQMKREETTREIPVVVVTAKAIAAGERERLSKASAIIAKSDLDSREARKRIYDLLPGRHDPVERRALL